VVPVSECEIGSAPTFTNQFVVDSAVHLHKVRRRPHTRKITIDVLALVFYLLGLQSHDFGPYTLSASKLVPPFSPREPSRKVYDEQVTRVGELIDQSRVSAHRSRMCSCDIELIVPRTSKAASCDGITRREGDLKVHRLSILCETNDLGACPPDGPPLST
jgi:hypothetical protein